MADVRARPQRHLLFVDDNLTADVDAACELCRGLVGLGKRWVCQVTMDVATIRGLVDLRREAGCALILIGLESLDEANLKQMGKGANLRRGDDHDGPDAALRLAQFAEEQGFVIGNFNPLMALPGTCLYDRLAGTGALVRETWWLDDDFRYGDAILVPAGMTPEQLTDSCREASSHALADPPLRTPPAVR